MPFVVGLFLLKSGKSSAPSCPLTLPVAQNRILMS